MLLTVEITYLVIDNDHPLHNTQPTEARVWKKHLTLTEVDVLTDTNPDWCYERIVDANPDFNEYTIAIWSVDKSSYQEPTT